MTDMLNTIQNFYRSTRAYEVRDGDLIIYKLFNLIRIPLREISHIQIPKNFRKGLKRVTGTNLYKNDEIGEFHPHITNWNNVIFLKTAGEFIAISPENTQDFIEMVKTNL